jgi:hypothetical protein
MTTTDPLAYRTTAARKKGASAALRRLHRRLLHQNTRLIELAGEPAERLAVQSARISAWSVGQHLEHLLRSGHSVLRVLDKLLAEPPRADVPGVRPIGRLMLFAGFIPRGRARTVKAVEPQGIPGEQLAADLAALHISLAALAGERLAALESSRGRFPHPVLGGLDARLWLRFHQVHLHHHLKIIRDIQRQDHQEHRQRQS